MKRSDVLELVKEEIKFVLNEEMEDSAKKMKEVIIGKIHENISTIAEWVIQGDAESFEKFFEKLQTQVMKKYGKYVDPERLTKSEIEFLQKFELQSKINMILYKTATVFVINGQQYTIYKYLYADKKRLAYCIEGPSVKSMSKAFDSSKKQSIRDLASVLKKLPVQKTVTELSPIK